MAEEMEPTLHSRRAPRVAAAIGVGFALALCAWLAPGASAFPTAHGHAIHIVKPGLGANTNKSNNWFGYNQGMLEQGGTRFHSISGNWKVPTARQHTKGQEEASSDWIGIGGGCVNANCTVGDNTLIQTGTEQDVSASGKPSYSAWWEVIPGPSIGIGKLNVHAGDRMHAAIAETIKGSELWKITLSDVTRHQTFHTTVPYTSTYATAEWIEETPLEIGTNAGLASLPNLSPTPFDKGSVNGRSPHLKSPERILLTDSKGKTIGTPSAPDADHDGFALCAWATKCRTPSS